MTKIDIKKPDPEETLSGAARVLTFFRDRLLSGELKAGDRLLPERELAAALEVSRPVLREALRSLAMLGLLDIQHGRGAFVRSADASVLGQALTLCLAPEPNILDDVLQARIAIECQAIRLACERATDAEVDAIEAAVDEIEQHQDADALPRRIEATARFFSSITLAGHNEALRLMAQTMTTVLRERMTHVIPMRPRPDVFPLRRKVVHCLRVRDAEGAVGALDELITMLRKDEGARVDGGAESVPIEN